MKTPRTIVVLLSLALSSQALGQVPQQQTRESTKYRTILTLAGGGGGFVLGLFAGLAAFDDATNSDRKVWTTTLLSAAGGAVGGYFLGRALDKGNNNSKITSQARLMAAPLSRQRKTSRSNSAVRRYVERCPEP